MALSQAMDFVKERKPDIRLVVYILRICVELAIILFSLSLSFSLRPNGGFLQQLKLWEKMKYKLDESNKSFRAYKLSHQAKTMRGMVT